MTDASNSPSDPRRHDTGPSLAELVALEIGVAAALRAVHPEQALRKFAENTELSPELRGRIASIDGDGFRLAALLVARLRFERLVQGSNAASRWFDQEPRTFTAAFRRYHASTPAAAHFPADEAALFYAWLGTDDEHIDRLGSHERSEP